MTRIKRGWRPLYDDDIQGARRREIIEEFLRWLQHRHLEQKPDLSNYPLAHWLEEHRKRLAQRRAETLAHAYRNSKGPRPRKAPSRR